MIQVLLNGERTELKEGTTVQDLFARLGLADLRGVAVEMNETFVEDTQYSALIPDGAVIEVVRFVGGG